MAGQLSERAQEPAVTATPPGTTPPTAPPERVPRRRLWLTIGSVVGVATLAWGVLQVVVAWAYASETDEPDHRPARPRHRRAGHGQGRDQRRRHRPRGAHHQGASWPAAHGPLGRGRRRHARLAQRLPRVPLELLLGGLDGHRAARRQREGAHRQRAGDGQRRDRSRRSRERPRAASRPSASRVPPSSAATTETSPPPARRPPPSTPPPTTATSASSWRPSPRR